MTDLPSQDAVVVTPVGPGDLGSALALREALVEALDHDRHDLVVDLDQLSFVESSTLGLLAIAGHRVGLRGGRLRIVCADRFGRRILTAAGLASVLEPRVPRQPRGGRGWVGRAAG